MKFRYYITSTFDGCIYGTNDDALAEGLAESEDNFVVDTLTGDWIQADLDRQPIAEHPQSSDILDGAED